jgi:hypothetical protein
MSMIYVSLSNTRDQKNAFIVAKGGEKVIDISLKCLMHNGRSIGKGTQKASRITAGRSNNGGDYG